jgi:tRNA(Ile)-lysidine synthetase-like protein
MKIDIEPGKYVVAVSGGVDSVVLLDLLRLHPHAKIVVAHFDHGIRIDSNEDRRFVEELARLYKLPYVYDKVNLGVGASEAEARELRYAFLKKAQKAAKADAIVTAHHQDDVLETAVINLLRGTGRKGLSSLSNNEGIVRPLLQVPKSDIVDYARRHNLKWHEDSTNHDTNYLRNHIRHNMLPAWNEVERKRLLDIVQHMQSVNTQLDAILGEGTKDSELDREWFILLPHNVAKEYLASWLRRHEIRDFDRNTLERLTVAAKVAEPGKTMDIVRGRQMRVHKKHLSLTPTLGRSRLRGQI